MKSRQLMLWVAAAVAAIGLTTAAVTVANAAGGRNDVLTQDEVSRQLDGQGGTPATSTPGVATRTPGGDAVTRTMQSEAGQVVASCDGDAAYLHAWTPRPGYRVDEVQRGPAPDVSLWIESDSFEDVTVLVQCEAGEPVLTDLVEPDDHGGDRHDDHDDHDDKYDDDHSGRG